MAEQQTSFFLKLFKKNQNRDKILIAADAICSIEERKEDNAVRIYTMDGFWYDVEDSIDMISEILPCKKINRIESEPKKDFDLSHNKPFFHKGRSMRKRKYIPPTASEVLPKTRKQYIEWDSQT